MLTVVEAIRNRHSIRRFKADPVPTDVVDLMLEAARILGWPRHVVVLCLLLAGYASEEPTPRPRLPLEEIIMARD